jgi:GNAT superfamily N-acetyltransferase
VIVPRTPAHLSACADLARITHRTDGYPIVLPDDINAFLAPAAQLAAWIARADGAVVGHVGLHRPTSAAVAHVLAAAGLEAAPIGVVSRLMVGPEGRGCGTGMALLDRATVDAHGRGLRPVLDVVTTYASAIRLYQRAGWEQIGVASVAMPNGKSVDEYVFVGAAQPTSRRT